MENRLRFDAVFKIDMHLMLFVEDQSFKGWLVINDRFDSKLDLLDHCIWIVVDSDAFLVLILKV